MGVGGLIGLIVAIVVIVLSFIIFVVSRIRKCPPDKIMVVYGKTAKNSEGLMSSAKCIHGGTKFIWPFFQAFQYMELTPISISVDLKNALSRQNIRVDVPSNFTVAIATEPGVMQNAAIRLLGQSSAAIQELARDIIFGQLRLVIATMDIEEINTDRDKFIEAVSNNVETELSKIGLRLINVNITDIADESGYIRALGKEAAAKAINDARRSVAEKDRDGAIGEAKAVQDQRVQVADANARAIEGENTAKGDEEKSIATLREVQAEALRRAETAEKIAAAKALEDGYKAQQAAELARAEREKATLAADIIVKAEVEKQERIIVAEAFAEEVRRKAQGDADAIYARLEAEARGQLELLTKQAAGFKDIVNAASGDAAAAVRLIIADKLETLVATQVEAIKNLKIDKVTVWDTGKGSESGSSTANFAQNLYKSIPPLKDLFDMAGMDLPKYLGTKQDEEKPAEAKPQTNKKKGES